jgi:L-seryl-tRNA(Ser) seleniumtransferase
VPVAEDLGSGYLGPSAGLPSLAGEPEVGTAVAAGVDAACFSGDKLLGGPQAGLIVGKRDALARIRKHPLMRALRVDKMTYAALEATLHAYAAGRASQEIPVHRMIGLTRDEIVTRATAVTARLRAAGYDTELREGVSTIGGGAAPGSELPTMLVAIHHGQKSAEALLASLRRARPPIVARIEQDRVVLDLRTVERDDDEKIVQVLTGGSDERF